MNRISLVFSLASCLLFGVYWKAMYELNHFVLFDRVD